MAEKSLKTITFEGLKHIYTIPETPEDIGAAPAGYGLGEVMEFSSIENIDNLYLSGNYRFFVDGGFSVAGANLWSFYMRVDGYDENNCTQTIYCGGAGAGVIRRTKYSTWGEWEWENPPMVLGVEYRTTERWNDKPVYCKLVDLGVSTSAKVITVLTSGNRMIRHVDRCSSYPLPHINGTMDSAYTYYLMPDQSGFGLKMFCGANVTGLQTYSVIYYYKE